MSLSLIYISAAIISHDCRLYRYFHTWRHVDTFFIVVDRKLTYFWSIFLGKMSEIFEILGKIQMSDVDSDNPPFLNA